MLYSRLWCISSRLDTWQMGNVEIKQPSKHFCSWHLGISQKCSVTVTGNILIFVLVVADWHLHKPLYFFLCNLSCLETCYSSTILPRMLSSFLTGDKSISIGSCITQFYFFGSLAVTESFLLLVMSYDWCWAICKPFHYRAVMNSRYCLQLVAWSWMNGFLVMAISCFLISPHSFCGPKLSRMSDLDHLNNHRQRY